MRGIDTNVLLRYLTCDDPSQSAIARRVIESAERDGQRLFVPCVVLCELAWTLRGPRYRHTPAAIVSVLERILETPLFEIESRDTVVAAVTAYREGSADFADFVIGEAARRAGCADTVTLDRKLSSHAGFTLLGE